MADAGVSLIKVVHALRSVDNVTHGETPMTRGRWSDDYISTSYPRRDARGPRAERLECRRGAQHERILESTADDLQPYG